MSNIIAWLVPTARGSQADKATHLPSNTHLTVPANSSTTLTSRLPNLLTSKPEKAIQLCFDQPPKRPGRITLGTDAESCDVVLPALAGISARHCALNFDAESRLTLEDFSLLGTQVWYDWDSNGDQTDYTWILSSGYSHGFPSTVQRITIDIQGVRFQVVVNDHSSDWDTYKTNVDAFREQPAWMDGLSAGWDRASITPVAPLFSAIPLFKHIFVKSLGEQPVGEVYLWNMAKPWEPMVRAAA
ncbi:Fc.00g031490.m01.CDS01 [Cosmosporella sp. VM-42]